MRAFNLPHLHLRPLRFARPHLVAPHPTGGHHPMHIRALGNIWALLLAAVLAVAMLVGLWASANPGLRLSQLVPF